MRGADFPLPVELDARLVEEAVLLCGRGHRTPEDREEREKGYAIRDEEEREAAFRSLSQRQFESLGLGEPLRRALLEEPLLCAQVGVCLVVPAVSRRDEGAELFVEGASPEREAHSRRLLLRLRPSSFSHPETLLGLLRHELFHVRDMVDPAFGYDPSLPEVEGGPMRLKLALNRYRVLWDTAIDGRLRRSGRAPEWIREIREAEFAAAFPMLGPECPAQFRSWFETEGPTHRQLLAFALDPAGAAGLASSAAFPQGICPLCRCAALGAPWEGPFPAALVGEIQKDFPDWRAQDGLCRQCAELYQGRPLSRAAANQLPGSPASV